MMKSPCVPCSATNPSKPLTSSTGSARGPRAGLGGPPKPLCPGLLFPAEKGLAGRSFRRAAENRTPAACAPRRAGDCTRPRVPFSAPSRKTRAARNRSKRSPSKCARPSRLRGRIRRHARARVLPRRSATVPGRSGLACRKGRERISRHVGAFAAVA